MPRFDKSLLLLMAVLAGGTALRLWGIDHGLPQSYYPDEAHLVKRALSFGSGDLNPHWFHKPAFLMYILFLGYGAYYVLGSILGLWTSVHDFAVGYVLNPSVFYLIGRCTITLFSVATLGLVYVMGKRHFGRTVGLMGALFLALTVGAIENSQDIKEDTPSAFFAALSLALLLETFHRQPVRFGLLSAGAAGVGSAIKAYPIVMLIPILATTVTRALWKAGERGANLKEAVRVSAMVLVVYWLAYFVFAPFSFLDPLGREATFSGFRRAAAGVATLLGGRTEAAPDDFYARQLPGGYAVVDYLRVLLADTGMGPVIGSAALLGWLWLLARREPRAFLICLVPALVAGTSVLVFPGYAAPRHQVPIYPLLALCGASLVVGLWRLAGPRRGLVYAAVGLALVHPAVVNFRLAVDRTKDDTRSVAKRWIEANVPAGAKLLVDENGPVLLTSEQRLGELIAAADRSDRAGQFTAHYSTYLRYQVAAARRGVAYDLHEIRKAWWRERETEEGLQQAESDYDRDYGNPLRPIGVESYDYYVANGFKFAVVHSDAYGPYVEPDAEPARNRPKYAKFYSALFERARPIATFSPGPGEYVGPEVRIFEFR